MAASLVDLVTADVLGRHAGGRTFARGAAYQEGGAVTALRWDGREISGAVDGSDRYRVRLREGSKGGLDASCTCPVGRDGGFCKHCVALGLAWLADPPSMASAAPGREELREQLVAAGAAPLADLLLELAAADELVEARLLTLAVPAGGTSTAFDRLEHAWSTALSPGRMIGWGEAWGFAQGLERVVDEVERQIEAGRAEEVIHFCERALGEVESVFDRVDDSDGELGGVVERLEDVHLAACEAGRPDPVPLAERLFRLEVDSEYGIFHDAVTCYADVLGDRGVARFVELTEEAWAALPPATERNRYGRRSTLERLLTSLRSTGGDVDGVVDVLARDLSSARRYGKIADALLEAGRVEEAIDWAERGLATYPGSPSDLIGFLCERYLEVGRADAAVELARTELERLPSAAAYERLRHVASPAGRWEDLREEARAVLRGPAGSGQARSELVHALIDEGDVEAAWVEAVDGGCAQRLLVELAQLREEEHPADALAVYQRQIGPAVLRNDHHTYDGAVEWLGKVRAILLRLDRADEFEHLVFDVRSTYGAKRNLVKRLDALGWIGAAPPVRPARPRAKRAV